MELRKDPKYSLRLSYPIVMRAGTLASVIILTTLMVVYPKFSVQTQLEREVKIEIEQLDIPEQTEQVQKAAPPSRPAIPIESESEDVAEDATIEETIFDEFEVSMDIPKPTVSDAGPRVRFIPYDDPPVPIGGYEAIRRNIVYPEIAQEAGIEGTVVVQAYIDIDGIVKDAIVLKGVPNTGLDEAAMNAVYKTKFEPAKQRDRKVAVWISIPIIFQLKG